MKCGFLRLAGGELYLVEHPASGGASRPAVVLAPPLGEERKSAHRALFQLAEWWSARGHRVLRFDYRNTGESPGAGDALRLAGMVGDVAAVRAAVGTPLILAGLRLGGSVALLSALADPAGVCRLLALAPVVSGAAELRRWRLRQKIRAASAAEEAQAVGAKSAPEEAAGLPEGSVDWDGLVFAAEFLGQLEAMDLVGEANARGGARMPVGLLQLGALREPSAEMRELAQALGEDARLEVRRQEPFWERVDPLDIDLTPTVAGLEALLG